MCGALHVGADHYTEKPQGKPQTKRQARLVGKEGEELPPAAGAAPLFRAALEAFERDVGSLERRLERLVGEGNGQRFAVERALPDDSRLCRKDHTENDWRSLCEDAGEDPAHAESLDAPPGVPVPGKSRRTARALGEAYRHVPPLRVRLEPLLWVLQPEPGGVDRDLLQAHIKGVSRKRGRSLGLMETRSVAGWYGAASWGTTSPIRGPNPARRPPRG